MERERAQYHAQVIGNGLLVAAGVILIVGLYALWRIGLRVDNQFGFGDNDLSFDDYLMVLWSYALGLITAVGIVGGLGLWFRWLAIDQDAKMVEFDMLLDALGAPVDEAAEGPVDA